ncbi:transglutaminase domain-containing protein [Psychrobacillus sp. FSL W7-1493]|uniref:transglutaminase domain-containing protein n=1 Tax=Psychrobacillus sp. FSL W7-1493 TaxID=2921552 RepID=UPI0030F85406
MELFKRGLPMFCFLCLLSACGNDSETLNNPIPTELNIPVPIEKVEADPYEILVQEKNKSLNLTPLDFTSSYASELGLTFYEPKYEKFSANGEVTIAGEIKKTDELKSNYIWINVQTEKENSYIQEQDYFVPISDGKFKKTVHFFNGEGTYKIKVQIPSTERENHYYDTANFEVLNVNPNRIRDVAYTPIGLEAGLILNTEVGYVEEDGIYTLKGSLQNGELYEDIMVRLSKDGQTWSNVIPIQKGQFTSNIPLLFGKGLHTLEVMIPDLEKDNFYKTATDLLIENTSLEILEPISYSSLYAERGINLVEPVSGEKTTGHTFHINGFIDPEATLSKQTTHLYVQTQKGEDQALEVIPIQDFTFNDYFHLRFGPGEYEVSISVPEITETKNDFFRYYEVAKFDIISTAEQDKRDILPSRGIESDAPQIIDLANSLTKGKTSELEKSKAIYDFVANTISYDVVKFQNDDFKWDDSALKTLNSQTGVCQDYAYLTIALLRASNIEARFVEGFTTDRHAWVEAKVDNRWVTMDPTWGAGYLNDNKEFIASFSEDYFDPEEEDFQKTHTRIGLVY